MSRFVPLRWLPLLSLLLISPVARARAATDSAQDALNQGRADEAARLLHTRLSANPHDAYARQLLCRVFYSEEMADAGIAECQAAVADAPDSSEDQMWLGRAYGMKAETANPISAFRLARKVVAAFEQAVALDPRNVAALSDLGEYYVAAPAIVGGGLDRARRLAERTMAVSPSKAHRILAMAAEKNADTATAEAEFRRAVEAQPSPASAVAAWVDLAAFYQRNQKIDACVAAVETAVRLDRARDASLVDAASILTDAGRSPELARRLLSMYLESPARSDAAPVARVRVQLGDLLRKSGDPAGARREYQAALELAANYAPAQKAIKALGEAPPAKAIP
jgi:tetratricopeptide (TPR) repeat protein